LWEWRNEPSARAASINAAYIPYQAHQRWFASKLEDPATIILVVLDNQGHEVGYVRFNIQGEEAEISLSLGRLERGKGYGAAAIRQGSDRLMIGGTTKRVVAYVKANNLASTAAFRRAGFVDTGVAQKLAGVPVRRLVYDQMSRKTSSAKHLPLVHTRPECS
jgi:RimJ/RimL family protein N-acetyltransferase